MPTLAPRFTGKACIVTGGGSGIGRATCLRLAAEGGRVAVLDRDRATADATVQAIRSAGGEGLAIACDIGVAAQIDAAVDQVLGAWQRIDVLVNDAAMMVFRPVVELPLADWTRVLTVNLTSVFHFCQRCLPHMRQGAIVNISSVHAYETTANVSSYAASKGGIEAFTRALSREIQPAQARVNCVAPGAVNTPMLWNNPNVKSGVEKVTGAIGQPEQLATAIAFMASDDAAFVHGTTLIVDGGRLDIL